MQPTLRVPLAWPPPKRPGRPLGRTGATHTGILAASCGRPAWLPGACGHRRAVNTVRWNEQARQSGRPRRPRDVSLGCSGSARSSRPYSGQVRGSSSVTPPGQSLRPGMFWMVQRITAGEEWFRNFAGLVRPQMRPRQFYRSARFTHTEQAVQWSQEGQACPFAFARFGIG